jgi:hypothetical protein
LRYFKQILEKRAKMADGEGLFIKIVFPQQNASKVMKV